MQPLVASETERNELYGKKCSGKIPKEINLTDLITKQNLHSYSSINTLKFF